MRARKHTSALLAFGIFVFGLFILPETGNATSQWTRKYKVPCSMCHTVFPRLNYYGEKFMRNGFQNPYATEPDGGTLGKLVFEDSFLDIGKLEDFFGVRLSFQPVYYKTKGLNNKGRMVGTVELGPANWVQLFTAGTITKNVSIFDELEVNGDGGVHHGWLILGFHNLFNSTLFNFQTGKISPVDFTSFSNRLRIFPEITGFASQVSSSSGAASAVTKQDSANLSSSQWGINYYGYTGPFVWSFGGGNSVPRVDLNQHKNFWGMLRAEITSSESPLEGSSISAFAYSGMDSATVSTAPLGNHYWRIQPAMNIRWGDLDAIAAFTYGEDENHTLTAVEFRDNFWGITGLLSYLIDKRLQLGAQYDFVERRRGFADEDARIAGHASYLLRQNLNLIFTSWIDLRTNSTSVANSVKNHQFFITIRSMI